MAIRLMPERNCAECTMQVEWGCRAKKHRDPLPEEGPDGGWTDPAYLPLTLDDEETYACPRQTIHENPVFWGTLLKYHGFYKKGFLPEKGSVIDQSNKLMEAFRILDQAIAECDSAEQDKRSRKKGDPFAKGA